MPNKRSVIVPAGELAWSGHRDRKLVTCVGSCVAVALYDPRIPLAGLLHAVCPRKGKLTKPGQTDGFFVDSGMRELLARMLDQGAATESLVASLAGGARLLDDEGTGPTIGSRNVEAAREALAKAGIRLHRCEVGGNRPWTVELDVDSGELRIRTSASCYPPQVAANAPATPAGELDRLARKIDSLPPNGGIAGELLAAAHETEFPWGRAASIISRDAILALRFFRLANSGYFGIPRGIGSLESAPERLGSKQLRRLCVIAATGRQGRSPRPELRELTSSMSHHSVASAVIARHLVQRGPSGIGEEAVTAALLHGVGTLGAAILREGGGNAEPDPWELGSAILAGWNIPGGIVDAVGRLSRTAPHGPEKSILAATTRLSCAVARTLGILCPEEKVFSNPDAEDLQRAGVNGSFEELLFEGYEQLRDRGMLTYMYNRFREGFEKEKGKRSKENP